MMTLLNQRKFTFNHILKDIKGTRCSFSIASGFPKRYISIVVSIILTVHIDIGILGDQGCDIIIC